MSKLFKYCVLLTIAAAPATAQTWSSNAPKIGPVNQPENMVLQSYPSSGNYCPQGLSPVTRGGVICCGTPNAAYTPPVSAPRSTMSCPAGVKGCS